MKIRLELFLEVVGGDEVWCYTREILLEEFRNPPRGLQFQKDLFRGEKVAGQCSFLERVSITLFDERTCGACIPYPDRQTA